MSVEGEIPTWVIPIAILVGGAIGWIVKQYQYIRETKKQAGQDADKTLKDKKTLFEEMISKTKNNNQKEELQRQLDEVNTALLGLYNKRLRRTLKDAGLPQEEVLITEGLEKLKPKQAENLKNILQAIESLPQPALKDNSLLILGIAYYYTNQYQNAINVYNKILENNPNNPLVLNNRGNTYADLKMFDKAFKDYNRALELKPDDPMFLSNRGSAYYLQSRYNEALDDLNHALSLREHPTTLIYRGLTYYELGRYKEAITDYSHALELEPDSADILGFRGLVYFHLDRFNEALDDYSNALEIKPNDPRLLSNRGFIYVKIHKYKEALVDYKNILQIEPNNIRTLYDIACLFSLWGKIGDSLNYLEKTLKKDKNYLGIAQFDKSLDNIRNNPRFKKLIDE